MSEKRQSVNADTEITRDVGISDKDFREATIKVLQQVITNILTLETDKKK